MPFPTFTLLIPVTKKRPLAYVQLLPVTLVLFHVVPFVEVNAAELVTNKNIPKSSLNTPDLAISPITPIAALCVQEPFAPVVVVKI